MSNRSSSYLDALQTLPVRTNAKLSPPSIRTLEPISIVVDLMLEGDVGAVVVVDDETPVGIITEKDVLERVVKPRKDFEKTLVKDVMSKPLISIEANRPIKEAFELLHEHNIRRLVVTDNGAIIGLTTERRLLEVARDQYRLRDFQINRIIPLNYLNQIEISFLSTYPPRECGIATFSQDLLDAISSLSVLKSPAVIAVNDKGSYYNYGAEVKFQIDREEIESYQEAAWFINQSDIKLVNLQHEFGLFGGVWGENIVSFIKELEKPVISTLHTLLPEPPPDSRRVLEGILEHSEYVVVMARVGIQILEDVYETLAGKVRYIPHGCPNIPFISSETVKTQINMKDRIVLSTFGLLSSGKGIEYAVRALPPIVEKDPRVLYLVIGETHPEVRKHEGETYRQQLIEQVESLGLRENVRFVNRFLPKSELIRFLQATDIYILPYPNKEQISSGTLLYALSTGKAIISTPFLHAKEVISEGGALESDFKKPESISNQIRTLLEFDHLRRRLEKRAYEYSRDMIWPNVAMKYVNLFYETLGM